MRIKGLLTCAALSALGLLGNWAVLPVGFSIDFIFGSVFTLMAAVVGGPVCGIASAAIAGSYTYVLWNHPYAIVILIAEAAFVSLVLKKRPAAPLFFVDLAFWLLFGTPLVFLFYRAVMGMGSYPTAIVALKQSLNGISNAVVASMLLNQLRLRRFFDGPEPELPPASRLFFETMAFLLLIPFMGGLMMVNTREIEAAQGELARGVKSVAGGCEILVTDWYNRHRLGAQHLVNEGLEHGFAPSKELQDSLDQLRTLFPDAHNLLMGNGEGKTIAFDPPVNPAGISTVGLDLSDREWFKIARDTGKTVLSSVFMGRTTRQQPVVVICEPYCVNNSMAAFAAISVNPTDLDTPLKKIAQQTGIAITLLDQKGQVVLSSVPGLNPLDRWSPKGVTTTPSQVEGVSLALPELSNNVPAMTKWKEASFLCLTPVAATGWTILTEAPLGPLRTLVYESTTKNIAVIFLLLFAANGASFWLARKLTAPLKDLGVTSADIPEKIVSERELKWPKPEIREVGLLVDNFKETSETLRRSILKLRDANWALEEKVAQRTAELKEREESIRAYSSNQRELLREVNHRVKNNLSLLISMLHMEAARLGDQTAVRSIEDIEHRVQALARVHSLLSSSEWRPVGLKELCGQIVSQSLPGEYEPRIAISGADVRVASTEAHNLALVINELATNSAKHACSTQPLVVTVEIARDGDAVIITYSDNGPGYPPEVLEGIAGSGSIGLQLVRGIVEMSLAGSVELANDGGAVARIRFVAAKSEESV